MRQPTRNNEERIVKSYVAMRSFDEEAAAVYDERDRRTDTMETVAFLEQVAGPR